MAAANCLQGSFDAGQLLTIETSYPEFARMRSVYCITVRYKNSSNIDIPIPTRIFESTVNNPISFIADELKPLPCSGLNCTANYKLTLDLKEPNGPPNILRAGAGGEIKVYMKALSTGTGQFRIIE